MIDPVTALAGIQSAISMVKKASKVANDLGSRADDRQDVRCQEHRNQGDAAG